MNGIGVGVISGPLSMHHVTTPIGKWLLIGEDHNFNGPPQETLGSRYINDLLFENDNFESIWIEVNDGQELAAMQSSLVKGPIKDMAARILNDPMQASKCNIKFVDVRRRLPFLLLDCVVNFGTFYGIYSRQFTTLKHERHNEIDKLKRIFTVCKSFEKQVYVNLSTRAKCRDLLMAFIDPSKSLPKWYQSGIDSFVELGFHKEKNAIHEMMRKLDQSTAGLIQRFAVSFIDMAIENSVYSLAMNSVIKTQVNHASLMVAKKYQRLQEFFVILFSVLMNTYVLCRMFAEGKANGTRVLLAGDNHIRAIMTFLLKFPIHSTDYSVYAEHGVLNMENKVKLRKLPLIGDPKEQLKSFRQRHNNAKPPKAG